MNFALVVHSVAEEMIAQEVTLVGGQVVTASVPGLVVELVDEADERNNQTFRFIPTEWAKARDLFTVGQAINLTLTKG